MTLAIPTSTSSMSPILPRKFYNAAEWLHALGDVPLSRIVMTPWPGFATEHDLLRLVEEDKRLCELIDGTLVEKPVGFIEGNIAAVVIWYLMNWVVPRSLGRVFGADTTMRMANGRVRLPDVSFITTARLESLPKPLPAIPTIGPDLAVEVLSDSNTKGEIDQKLREFFDSGTRLAWIIDPQRRIVAVYVPADYSRTAIPTRILSESDDLDGGDVLPGFTVPVSALFTYPPQA